jgi:rSAM/selenodomain-associated transferase 1
MRCCLIIVAKEPVAGQVKTRLAARIGTERTLALYNCFLRDTAALAEQLPDTALAFSFWPATAAPFFRELRPDALLFPQHGDDFGSRLLSGFEQAAAHGFDAMVVIGSDNPGLPAAYIGQAFAALRDYPVVLGPADDGGYYLLGMRTPQPALFHQGIVWSTELVAQQTCAAAAAAGLTMAHVPAWYDIDNAADLPHLYRDLRAAHLGAYAPQTLAQLEAMAQDGLADLLPDSRPTAMER